MKKAKDIFWLLFWGIIAGTVFVGCILGFGQAINWLNSMKETPLSSMGFKVALLVFILAVLAVLFKIALVFNNKITHKQAAKVFPPELLDFIYQAPVARAVVQQREDQLDGLRFLPDEARIQAVNAPVHNGITPLHVAAALGRKKFCVRLLKLGANLQAKDANGQTPADYAARFNQQETLQFLQNYHIKAVY